MGEELRRRGVGGECARATGGGNEGARGSSVVVCSGSRGPSSSKCCIGSEGGVVKCWSMAKSRAGGGVVVIFVVVVIEGRKSKVPSDFLIKSRKNVLA